MIKVIPPGACDFGLPVASIVDIHTNGVDSTWMQKRAADFSCFKGADIKPDKDHSYLHIISLGAMERYGSNKNGDSWNHKAADFRLANPKDGISPIYKMGGGLSEFHDSTYMKHGHVFDNHVNQDPAKSIGEIKWARYNPNMYRGELLLRVPHDRNWEDALHKMASGKDIAFSMAAKVPFDVCFKAGTQVLTDRGLRSIETIEVGDSVLSHTGAFRKVTKVFKNEHAEPKKAIAIKLRGTATPIIATENHPFLVLSSKAAAPSQKTWRRREYADADTIVGVEGYEPPDFVEAGNMANADYCLFPIRSGNRAPKVDPWLAGLYLADGSVFGRKAGRKKTGHWRLGGVHFSLGLDKYEIVERLVSKLKEMGVAVKVYPCKDKKAVTVVTHSVQLAQELCNRFGRTKDKRISADVWHWNKVDMLKLLAGWLDGDGSQDPKKGSVRGCSVLDTLAAELQMLSFCAGVPATLHRASLEGSEWAVSPHVNVLFFSTTAASRLAEHSTKIVSMAKTKSHGSFFYLEHASVQYVAVPVEKVEQVDGLSVSYNLSVEEDETYVAGLAAVHNCTECGNKATKRAQYCGHLRDHMTEITKSGNQISAINDYPDFFDISKVVRPADPIAWTLEKVANAAHAVGGAALAEALGLTEQESNELPEHFYTPSTFSQRLRKLAVAKKLAEIEKQVDAMARSEDNAHLQAAARAHPVSKNLSEPVLKKLASAPMGGVLKELNAAKIQLSLHDFLKLAAGGRFSPQDVVDAAAQLPGIYNSEHDKLASDGAYDSCDFDFASRDIKDLIHSLTDIHSLADGPAAKRVRESVVKCGSSPVESFTNTKSATLQFNKTAIALAREYAKYQLSFAAGLDSELGQTLTVLGNYIKL